MCKTCAGILFIVALFLAYLLYAWINPAREAINTAGLVGLCAFFACGFGLMKWVSR